MPEGDTVYLAAKRLDALLAGQRIDRSDVRLPSLAVLFRPHVFIRRRQPYYFVRWS